MTDLESLVWPDGTAKVADSGFPIHVMLTAPDGTVRDLEEVKVLLIADPQAGPVGAGYVLGVWTKGSGAGPELALLEEVAEIESVSPKQRLMTLADDTVVQYGPSRHCGCGSRLRGFKPFADARLVAVGRPAVPWVYTVVQV